MATLQQSGSGAPASPGRKKQLRNIRESILRATATGELPGIVTLVQDYGTPPWIEVAGWRDVDRRERMHADTIFDLRSITKTVTALASLLLVADEKLSFDEPVAAYIPEIRGITQNGGDKQSSHAITLRHLLTHTSGLSPSRPVSLAQLTEKRDVPLLDVVRRLVKEPLVSEPGSKWVYSSPGYAVVGRIVEVISGEPLEEFITKRVLAPLGMRNTAFNPPRRARGRMATLYEWKNDRLLTWPRTMPAETWAYTAPD